MDQAESSRSSSTYGDSGRHYVFHTNHLCEKVGDVIVKIGPRLQMPFFFGIRPDVSIAIFCGSFQR